MVKSIKRQSSHSLALLAGIAATILVMLAHPYLPERRLAVDSQSPGAEFYLLASGDSPPSTVEWVNQSRFHYVCKFPKEGGNRDCSFHFNLHGKDPAQGMDLSKFKDMRLVIRYQGAARYIRVAIRNFDPRFSKDGDGNSAKFNYVSLNPRDLQEPLTLSLKELRVPEWWIDQYSIPRQLALPDLSNATVLAVDLLGELAGTEHDIQIEKVEFTGDLISAEYWYMGIICLWLLAASVWGVTQWATLRRKEWEQARKIHELVGTNEQLLSEKERYQKLSTVDALTSVLNRHGIDQFIESLSPANLPVSVIVIDLDHFKRVNDQRGHHVGDRVLQMLGEILRMHTRHTDGLGRWGGEEFVLICPGATLSKAAELAEKLRLRILETNFLPEDPLTLTASFGVATSSTGESFEEAFRQADQALYLAKSRGRNCVVAAAEDQLHKMTGARKGTWAVLSGRFKLHK